MNYTLLLGMTFTCFPSAVEAETTAVQDTTVRPLEINAYIRQSRLLKRPVTCGGFLL